MKVKWVVYREKGQDMAQQIQAGEVDQYRDGVDLEDVTAWAVGLEAIHARIAHYFARSEPRQRVFGLFEGFARKRGTQE